MSSLNSTFIVKTKDVYDFAYEIAEEFDKLVSLQGIDSTKSLIHKIINVLETLEASVYRIECLEKEIIELKSKYSQLTTEKVYNDLEKEKLKLSFEETEEVWNKELKSLKTVISVLKSENQLLKKQTLIKTEQVSDDSVVVCEHEREDLIMKLKTCLKKKDKQLAEITNDNDILKQELDQVLQLNKSLHLSNSEAQKEIRKLKMENFAFETKLDLFEQRNSALEQTLAENISEEHEKREFYEVLAKENACMKHLKTKLTEVDVFVKERNDMVEKVKILDSQLQLAKDQAERYKRKFLKLSAQNNQGDEVSNIRKLFHLFLGFPASASVPCCA